MDLLTFEGVDSRENPFEERGSDVNDHGMNSAYKKDFGSFKLQ